MCVQDITFLSQIPWVPAPLHPGLTQALKIEIFVQLLRHFLATRQGWAFGTGGEGGT